MTRSTTPARSLQPRISLASCLLFLVGACLLHALAGYSHRDLAAHAIGSDDAYISYRYARNLAAGHGLVFNPGERVEGYSNLLYVLLLSIPHALLGAGLHIYAISVALNILLAAAAVWALQRFLGQRLDPGRAAWATLLFVCCPSLWLWVASGLETVLFVLLVLLIWFGVEQVTHSDAGRRASWLLSGSGCLLILTRADGFVPVTIAIGYLLLKRATRPALAAGAAAAGVFGLQLLWRLGYYGFAFPNTYYVKLSGPLPARFADALLQLRDLAVLQLAFPIYLLVFLLGSIGLARRSRRPGGLAGEVGFELFFALAWIAYWLYLGGDQLGERFLLVLLPLGISFLVRSLPPRPIARPWTRPTLLALLALLQLASVANDPRFAYKLPKYDMWITLGRFLGARHPMATLAIDACGKVPYFSNLETIDMLGLNDVHIAHLPVQKWVLAGHNKFDPDYVLARRPDLIATWAKPDLDLYWGLDRERYRSHGYALAYLVNSQKHSRSTDVVDVRGRPKRVVKQLFARGYTYAVLERLR